ncbi:arginase family protein [Indivirus ILV1]|uniref:Arginase family protein n=1 Tax=Indivirus ILV1 TaxID=1977633 RepID=A0A1V0SD83_9VIRU|nr:arginase family protein [Indivirus ILV1]
MNQLHFIKAQCHQSNRSQGFQFAPDEIKEKYDYDIKIESRSDYIQLYSHISQYLNQHPSHKIITIGGDNSISSGTIPAINERYSNNNLFVLWIDSSPDIHNPVTSPTKNFDEMPCASILGLCGDKFIKSKMNILPCQLIYYGLNDDNDQMELVRNYEIPFFTSNKISNVGCDKIINVIKEIIGDRPVHVSLDMKVFTDDIIKTVIPKNKNGLKIEDVEKLLVMLKNNIVSMDVTEFNPMIGTKNDVKVTRELIRYLLIKTFNVKEKSINIFTEDSYFLVYRPLEQDDLDNDIGWYILRGLDIETKNSILDRIEHDKIITFDVDDESYLITKTNMNEQNENSYYTAQNINDVALFPQEKALMMFELVNT